MYVWAFGKNYYHGPRRGRKSEKVSFKLLFKQIIAWCDRERPGGETDVIRQVCEWKLKLTENDDDILQALLAHF